MHREICRTGVICALKGFPKILVFLLYCYGFIGINKDTYITKVKYIKTTSWYQNKKMNKQGVARGDNALNTIVPEEISIFT